MKKNRALLQGTLVLWQQAFPRSPSGKGKTVLTQKPSSDAEKNKAAGTHSWSREPASLLAPWN